MLCNVTLRYVTLCYVMLCYVMLFIFLMFVCFQLIMVPGYTQEEKIAISKRHLLPKQLKVGVLLSKAKIHLYTLFPPFSPHPTHC